MDTRKSDLGDSHSYEAKTNIIVYPLINNNAKRNIALI